MNPTSAEQQDSEQQYDFVLYDPQEACNDAAGKDIITSGTDGMVAGPPPYPNKSSGIPGRRGHLVPGSSRPWRVKKEPNAPPGIAALTLVDGRGLES
jgi:hypothetical protein